MDNNGDVSQALQANGFGQLPYLMVLMRVALAVGLGLFVGMERERRGKEAGIRTFAFAALLGCLGGLLGDAYALVSLCLLGILIVFLNWQRLMTNQTAELTTSVALLVVGVMGVLCGKGHNFTPVTVGILAAALLAWKERMEHFSEGLTGQELRSAILLAILAFVIYPVLPKQPIDPWGLIEPRPAWVTVLMIAAVSFVNYILLKLYGTRGSAIAGFLGGLVNSAVTVTELAARSRENAGADPARESTILDTTYQGVLLAIAAMLIRNGLVLAFLSFAAFLAGAIIPLLLMLVTCGVFVALTFWHPRQKGKQTEEPSIPPAALIEANAPGEETPVPSVSGQSAPPEGLFRLESPFSLPSTLKFGLAFLILKVAGTLAQRMLGAAGLYAVSLVGGLISSSSAVAAAGTLAARDTSEVMVAGIAAALASVSSVIVSIPLVARVAGHRDLTVRLSRAIAVIVVAGVVGVGIQHLVSGK